MTDQGTELTLDKMRATISALRQAEERRIEGDMIPVFVGPREFQDMLDVARPSRRWARRFIRHSRRPDLGLGRDEAFRSPAARFRHGRTAAVRRFINRRVRQMPTLAPSILSC